MTVLGRMRRLSIRGLLGIVAAIAVICAVVGNRLQRERAEHARLHGKWQVIDSDGLPVVLPNGHRLTVEFTPETYAIDVFSEPKSLDFPTSGGISHGIYRWEGRRLRVVQSSVGLARPASFEDTSMKADPTVKPAPTTCSVTSFLLERIAAQ